MNPLSSLPPYQDLSADDPKAQELLGPLFDMIGIWTNDAEQGWNLIAVPGPIMDPPTNTLFDKNHGFILETIPYIETTTYTPIAVTLNRGQFVKDETTQQIQEIGALLYEQRIVSAGVASDHKYYDEITAFFKARGFSKGTAIHAEQGMLLNMAAMPNVKNNGDFQIARMGTIPHGNAMLCLGAVTASTGKNPNIDANANSAIPTAVDPKQTPPLDYDEGTYSFSGTEKDTFPFSPQFTPGAPNQTLINANKDIKSFDSVNQLTLSTENGTGGLLDIPFVGGGISGTDSTKINTTKMSVDYWISKYTENGVTKTRLQYVQNVNLTFPGTGDPTVNINWPHIGLNTMYKVGKK